MSVLERAGLALLHRLEPERAHAAALYALRLGLAPRRSPPTSPTLTVHLAGLELPNPVGLAAGFDKNATAVAALQRSGFGFVEVGAVTPRPQPGNPRPRLFRLPADRAVINRFGFNNDGAQAVARRLARVDRTRGIVGINLGANKETEDKAADFAEVLRITGPHVDFATVNVSSPNTEGLRDLQARDVLAGLLDQVLAANAALARPVPVFVKIAPDLDGRQLDDIAAVVLASGVAGVIATNTTVARSGLTDRRRDQAGGLSGVPLMGPSTRILAEVVARVSPRLPVIGVGGIASAADAREKLRCGAVAVQLYTALTYQGLGLAARIARGLDEGAAR